MSLIRRILKTPFNLAMDFAPFRRRAAFEFSYRHFGELGVTIPLSHGFACPILERDALYSFSEIFVTAEYGNFLEMMPMPRRWVDLGCHAGYFSLYLAWQHAARKTGLEYAGLLVDADGRAAFRVSEVLRGNRLEGKFQFHHGAISREPGEVRFAQRDGMGSSLGLTEPNVSAVEVVRVLGPKEMAVLLPPPYDLIKIDIEGGELDFLAAYEEVYLRARFLMIEWHSWDSAGLSELTVRQALEAKGFALKAVLRPKTTVQVDGKPLSAGIHLYERQ